MSRSLAHRRSCPLWASLGIASTLVACQIEVDSPPEDDPGIWRSYDDGPYRAAPPAEPLHETPVLPPSATYEEPSPPSVPLEPSLPPGLYRDLIVIEPAVVNGPRADSTRADAPWSFRAQMQWLAGAAREPSDFARAWLEHWEHTVNVGPAQAPVTPRPRARALLIDPWLPAPAAEAAPTTAGYAPLAPTPNWENIPFRLIAIVNRVDLAADPCSGFAGELRYVYAAVAPTTGQALDMTVILEVPYPTSRPASEWARAWAELAELPPGEGYQAGLEELTRELQVEGDPLRVRLRSNEAALADAGAEGWELREFHLEIRAGRLELAQVPLELTPRADLDPALLAQHVLENSEQLRTSAVSLPEAWRAGAAELADPEFSWPVLGVSERLRQAFSLQTCNGCHGGDTASLPFRHVEPGASVTLPARLSRFLYDPDAPTDELRRRSERLDALSASVCEAPDPPLAYPGE